MKHYYQKFIQWIRFWIVKYPKENSCSQTEFLLYHTHFPDDLHYANIVDGRFFPSIILPHPLGEE